MEASENTGSDPNTDSDGEEERPIENQDDSADEVQEDSSCKESIKIYSETTEEHEEEDKVTELTNSKSKDFDSDKSRSRGLTITVEQRIAGSNLVKRKWINLSPSISLSRPRAYTHSEPQSI